MISHPPQPQTLSVAHGAAFVSRERRQDGVYSHSALTVMKHQRRRLACQPIQPLRAARQTDAATAHGGAVASRGGGASAVADADAAEAAAAAAASSDLAPTHQASPQRWRNVRTNAVMERAGVRIIRLQTASEVRWNEAGGLRGGALDCTHMCMPSGLADYGTEQALAQVLLGLERHR